MLMFGAMTRAAERWRRVRFTEFERRQIEAVTQELDAEHEAANTIRHAPQQGLHRHRRPPHFSDSTPATSWPSAS
jgi:hypothetical protein